MIEEEDTEYFVVPEEAFQHLPDDIRDQYESMASDGRAVLKSVDKLLNQAGRISRSMIDLVTLRHTQERLWGLNFKPDMESFLELDMLTTAFVVTYVRLQQGGGGSGFARESLPEHLRAKHDEIIELRNKRFAHSDDHHSVTDMMEINYSDDAFEILPSLSLRVQVGGAPEWKELVEAIESIFAERSEKLVSRLTAKTGHRWAFAQRPSAIEPEETVDSLTDSSDVIAY